MPLRDHRALGRGVGAGAAGSGARNSCGQSPSISAAGCTPRTELLTAPSHCPKGNQPERARQPICLYLARIRLLSNTATKAPPWIL